GAAGGRDGDAQPLLHRARAAHERGDAGALGGRGRGMTTADALRDAIDEGRVAERLWLYSNYHCNLACSYCLTDSAPGVPRRLLAPAQMVEAAEEASVLGFRALGVTGGEPFVVPEMPDILAELARRLPVLVLSNATLF